TVDGQGGGNRPPVGGPDGGSSSVYNSSEDEKGSTGGRNGSGERGNGRYEKKLMPTNIVSVVAFNVVYNVVLLNDSTIEIGQGVSGPACQILRSAWAPPAWMKTNGMVNGNGTLRDGPGSTIWESYSRYLIKFLDAYKDAGVDVWGMTVQNEPMTGFVFAHRWNTCGFTAAKERDFITQHLGPNLRAAGYNTSTNFSLMILDDDREYIQNWTDTILGDPTASQFVAGSAIHFYFDEAAHPDPVSVLDKIDARFNKFILLTKASRKFGDDPVGLGSWNLAESYLIAIIIRN
ncbi:Glucosylceramidase, partial [Folsomia candida]